MKMQMNYLDFLSEVERVLANVIQKCSQFSWEENHITYSLIEELTSNLTHIEINGFRPFQLNWEGRKLTGKIENSFGDIGIFVRIQTRSGHNIQGIGFLEAKRINKVTRRFNEIRKDQLIRLLKNASNSKLLLYDNDGSMETMDNLGLRNLNCCPFNNTTSFLMNVFFTYCVVVPTNLALTTKIRNTELYEFGIPFSLQLCERYFRGLDLEFDNEKIKEILNFFSENGGLQELLLIGVSYDGTEPELPVIRDFINQDLYGPMRSDRS